MTTITQNADLQLGEDHQIIVSLQIITTWTIVEEADLIVGIHSKYKELLVRMLAELIYWMSLQINV